MSFFFFSSRRRHTRLQGDWSSDVCSSDLSRFNLHQDRLAARSNRQFHWQFGDVGLEVFLLLPAVAIQALAKITLVVEQADKIGRASCRERVKIQVDADLVNENEEHWRHRS